jgi:transposase
MNEGEIIKQLQEQNEQLKCENELLRAKICELEARLAQYENAHSPPSLRRGRNRKNDKDNKGKPGQKIGHKGVTRPNAVPDSQVEVTADRCLDCDAELGSPFELRRRLLRKFPDLSPSWSLNTE